MAKLKNIVAAAIAVPVWMIPAAYAVDNSYMKKLERSGCTQVTELQGCDINKTKAENQRAGFAAPSASKPRYKDLVHQSSIVAIDVLMERGFKNVDTITSTNTVYGIYYYPASQLCIQMTMAGGEVVSIDNIHTHPNCR